MGEKQQLESTDDSNHETPASATDSTRQVRGVQKSAFGFGLSAVLMIAWLLFLSYLAIRLGQ